MRTVWRAAVFAIHFALASAHAKSVDIPSLWNFDDPAASEQTFRSQLATATGDLRLELLTQIARTYGLRRRFDDAHRLLDELEPQMQAAGAAPRVRQLLERGRTWRSSGKPDAARPLFLAAWNLARTGGLDGLAVDAAHMVALVEPQTDDQLAWNRRALDLAERSSEPYARNWKASLYNNIGWTLHDAGRFEEALKYFEAAVPEREARQQVNEVRLAKWAVARCLRSLKRFDDAMTFQRALEREYAATGRADGYVLEEIAELLDTIGTKSEAIAYFKRAVEELGKDEWFVRNEGKRLARLREKARIVN